MEEISDEGRSAKRESWYHAWFGLLFLPRLHLNLRSDAVTEEHVEVQMARGLLRLVGRDSVARISEGIETALFASPAWKHSPALLGLD